MPHSCLVVHKLGCIRPGHGAAPVEALGTALNHPLLPSIAATIAAIAADDGASEPPLKRARSSSGGLDNTNSSAAAAADSADGGPDDQPGINMYAPPAWRGGDDSRESRDAALNAELARYMIRTEPLGTDRHHQRYWYMQVRLGRNGAARVCMQFVSCCVIHSAMHAVYDLVGECVCMLCERRHLPFVFVCQEQWLWVAALTVPTLLIHAGAAGTGFGKMCCYVFRMLA